MSTQTEPKLVTQIDFARAGQITPQMKEVAEREHRDPEHIRERVADGRIAIPANIVHIKKGMRAFGVGEGLSTKVNVNLGISGDKDDAAEEWKKVKIAEDYGADAILSTPALPSCPCTPCGRSPTRPTSTRPIAATRPSSSAPNEPS